MQVRDPCYHRTKSPGHARYPSMRSLFNVSLYAGAIKYYADNYYLRRYRVIARVRKHSRSRDFYHVKRHANFDTSKETT